MHILTFWMHRGELKKFAQFVQDDRDASEEAVPYQFLGGSFDRGDCVAVRELAERQKLF
jgi:hypothetical protein